MCASSRLPVWRYVVWRTFRYPRQIAADAKSLHFSCTTANSSQVTESCLCLLTRGMLVAGVWRDVCLLMLSVCRSLCSG